MAKGEVFEGMIRIKLRDKGYVTVDGFSVDIMVEG
jgi:hypothetical protein